MEKIWTEERLTNLREWYPHYGSIKTAELLDLKKSQVKAWVDRLELKMLPKIERKCIDCNINHQVDRARGYRCNPCHLAHRTEVRKNEVWTTEYWIRRHCVHIKRRAKDVKFDITPEYLMGMWGRQEGKCHYSDIKMIEPRYGGGQVHDNPFVATIDKIDPNKGYIMSNVVWCCWACNNGKGKLSVSEYTRICEAVVGKMIK